VLYSVYIAVSFLTGIFMDGSFSLYSHSPTSHNMCKAWSRFFFCFFRFLFTMARIARGNKPTADDSKPVARTITTRKAALTKIDKRQTSLRPKASSAPISSIKVDPTKPPKPPSAVANVSTLKPAPKKLPPVPVTPSLTSVDKSPSLKTDRNDNAIETSGVFTGFETDSTSGDNPPIAAAPFAAAPAAVARSRTDQHETGRSTTTGRDQQAFSTAATARASTVGNFASASTLVARVGANNGPNKNVPDLALFGIQGTAPPNGTIGVDRNATLKCCVIRGPNKFALVFRVHANHPMFFGSHWGDKLFFDCVRERRQWVVNLSISDRLLKWYDRNLPQQNSKGFFIRLYVIYAKGDVPPKQNLLDLGKVICDQINQCVGNNTVTTVDTDNYFWGGRSAVWSDVVGIDEAQVLLYKETNVVEPMPGFYEVHKDLILSYFREGQLPASVGARMYAPFEAIAQSLDDGVPILHGHPEGPMTTRVPAQEDYSQLPFAAMHRSFVDADDDNDSNDNINKNRDHYGKTGYERRTPVDNEDDADSYTYTDYATDDASKDE